MTRGLLPSARAIGRDPWAHQLAEDVYAVAVAIKEKAGETQVLPPDQWALIYTAAAGVTPTILKRCGVPVAEENVRPVESYLLQVWGNALLTLDARILERLKAEAEEG